MHPFDHPRATQAARPARRMLAVAALATFAFTVGAPAPAAAQACEDPKVLKFSIIPTQESVRELTLYKPVMDLLSKNTGKKIEFYMPTSYSSVVEALMGKWVDVAVLGPESYVIAHNKDADDRGLRHLLQEQGRRPGCGAGLQVAADHQERIEVHDHRFVEGFGDAAGRSCQHLGRADSRGGIRQEGHQHAAQPVLQQGRLFRRPRPVDPRRRRRHAPTPPLSPATAS